MTYPKEFITFLVHYHGTRDYFECHEVLEDYWKEVDPGNKKSHWVGFILIAVSAYHHRRENFIGAEKTIKKAISIMEDTNKSNIVALGIDYPALLSQLNTTLINIQQRKIYKSLVLPVNNEEILSHCKYECHKNGLEWCAPTYHITEELKHRHILRDRSGIIKERERQKTMKKKSIQESK